MLGHSVPRGYRRGEARHRPKLAAHIGFIDQILADDLDTPKKQRHTIQRIYDRLREERGFDGGYTMVRDYVHPRRLTMREAFVPLAHPVGHAQADFGEARAEFVDRRENIIALGPSGVGKTHLAIAIGLAACQHGIKTRFATAAAIVHELIEARDKQRLLRLQKQLANHELLIIDELGFVPLSNLVPNYCSS